MEKYLSVSETAIPLGINWKVRLLKGFVQFQPSAFHIFRCILLLLHIKFAALVSFSSVAQSKRNISLDFRQLFNIFLIVNNLLLTYRPIHGPLSLPLLLTSSHASSLEVHVSEYMKSSQKESLKGTSFSEELLWRLQLISCSNESLDAHCCFIMICVIGVDL